MRGILSILLVLNLFASSLFAQKKVIVGVSENPPLVYRDTLDDKPKGLFIDVLQYIARKESWILEYRYGTFNQNIQWLEDQKIDIMPDLAFSDERDKRFLFHEKPVLNSWGQIYSSTSSTSSIDDIFDLEELKIGYVTNDYFVENPVNGLRDQFKIYGIEAEFVAYNSYEEISRSIYQGDTDAGVLNRIFGELYKDQYDLVARPIVFSPVGLYFAISTTRSDLVPPINRNLIEIKSTSNSPFSAFIKKYMTTETVPIIPEWIRLMGIIGAGSLLLLGLFIGVLRVQVKRKTEAIREGRKENLESIKRLRIAMQSAKEGLFTYDPEPEMLFIDEHSYGVTGKNLAGKRLKLVDFLKYVHPEDRDSLLPEELQVFLDSKKEMSVQFRIMSGEGDQKWVQADAEPHFEADKTYLIGTLRNIDRTMRAQMETQELLNAIQYQNKVLDCLFHISRLVSDPSISRDEVLKSAADIIPTAMKHPEHSLVIIDTKNKQYRSENYLEPVFRVTKPIQVDGQEFGSIIVGSNWIGKNGDEEFSAEEINMLNAVTKQIGNLLDRETLYEKIEESEFNERERIAKELHDGIQQTLTVAAINMNNALNVIEKDSKNPPAEKLKTAMDYLSKSINGIRTIAHELSIDYVKSVEKLTHDIDNENQLKINFYHNLDHERLPAKIEKELLRITQEAINNIIKHSKATKADIQLMKYDDLTILTIEDNGTGFDVQEKMDSFGISSMKKRTTNLNGIFTIDSNKEKGTNITIEIPNN